MGYHIVVQGDDVKPGPENFVKALIKAKIIFCIYKNNIFSHCFLVNLGS